MKRYRFRLEPVLTVCARAEETASRRLNQARQKLSLCREQVQQARQGRWEHDLRSMTEAEAGLPAARLLERRAVSEMLRKTVENGLRQGMLLEEAVEQRYNEWLDKRKARKSLENLKERQRKAWREKAEREEQKMMDETASNRFARRAESRGGAAQVLLVAILALVLAGMVWYGARMAGQQEFPILTAGTGFTLQGDDVKPGSPASGRIEGATGDVDLSSTVQSVEDLSSEYQLSSSELRGTLDVLEKREKALRARAEELDNWEKRLQKRQQDIDVAMVKCDEIRDRIESELQELRDLKEWRDGEERRKREADLVRLTKLYEKSRPKDAARMIAELPVDSKTGEGEGPITGEEVLISMNERTAVKVLSELSKSDPELANEYLRTISENSGKVEKGSVR